MGGKAKRMNKVAIDDTCNALRISLSGWNYLELAEVQVEGTLGAKSVGNIKAKYYDAKGKDLHMLPNFADLGDPYNTASLFSINMPTDTEVTATFGKPYEVAGIFKGFLVFEDQGDYDICLSSDDGSRLYIDGDVLIDDNDGLHGIQERCGQVSKRGEGKRTHLITIEYFQRSGGSGLILEWVTPSSSEKVVIPADSWSDASLEPPTTPPTQAPTATNDISVEYFKLDNKFKALKPKGFDGLTAVKQGSLGEINLPWHGGYVGDSELKDYVGVKYTGRIKFETAGVYELCLNSGDGSMLYIDNELKINNDGIHNLVKKCYKAYMDVADRDFVIEYFEYNGWSGIEFTWKKPGDAYDTLVPSTAFATAEE